MKTTLEMFNEAVKDIVAEYNEENAQPEFEQSTDIVFKQCDEDQFLAVYIDNSEDGVITDRILELCKMCKFTAGYLVPTKEQPQIEFMVEMSGCHAEMAEVQEYTAWSSQQDVMAWSSRAWAICRSIEEEQND